MRILILFFLFPFCLYGQEKIRYMDPSSHPDTIREKTTLINRIFLSDSFCITLNSSGCFHQFTSQYFVVKKNGAHFITHLDQNNLKTKIKTLENKKYKSLHDVCINGLSIGLGLCTTKGTVYISDKRNITSFSDDRCSDKDDYLDKIETLLK